MNEIKKTYSEILFALYQQLYVQDSANKLEYRKSGKGYVLTLEDGKSSLLVCSLKGDKTDPQSDIYDFESRIKDKFTGKIYFPIPKDPNTHDFADKDTWCQMTGTGGAKEPTPTNSLYVIKPDANEYLRINDFDGYIDQTINLSATNPLYAVIWVSLDNVTPCPDQVAGQITLWGGYNYPNQNATYYNPLGAVFEGWAKKSPRDDEAPQISEDWAWVKADPLDPTTYAKPNPLYGCAAFKFSSYAELKSKALKIDEDTIRFNYRKYGNKVILRAYKKERAEIWCDANTEYTAVKPQKVVVRAQRFPQI